MSKKTKTPLKKQNALSKRYENLLKKDFSLSKRFKYFIIPPIAVFLIAIVMFAFLGFNLGIDFTGGTIVKVNFGTNVSNADYDSYKVKIENTLKDYSISNYSLQKEGGNNNTSVSLKFQDLKNKSETEMTAIISDFKNDLQLTLNGDNSFNNFSIEDSQRIGASASSNLLRNALLAISLAAVLILIYIIIRFEYASGIAAITTLLHDVLLVTAFVIIFRIQVNSSFIAALITIIGYSINNTIVIFDRIRENLRKEEHAKKSNSEIVDVSVKATLLRTIYTSCTTVGAVFLLTIIGVPSIREFLIPIVVGLLGGTYSSIFLSGPIWSFIYKRSKDKKLNKGGKDKQEKDEKIPDDKIVV